MTPQEHSNDQRLVRAFMLQSERATRTSLNCCDALFALVIELEQINVPREVPSVHWRNFAARLDSIELLLSRLRACAMNAELESVRLTAIEKRLGHSERQT